MRRTNFCFAFFQTLDSIAKIDGDILVHASTPSILVAKLEFICFGNCFHIIILCMEGMCRGYVEISGRYSRDGENTRELWWVMKIRGCGVGRPMWREMKIMYNWQ